VSWSVSWMVACFSISSSHKETVLRHIFKRSEFRSNHSQKILLRGNACELFLATFVLLPLTAKWLHEAYKHSKQVRCRRWIFTLASSDRIWKVLPFNIIQSIPWAELHLCWVGGIQAVRWTLRHEDNMSQCSKTGEHFGALVSSSH
jgi:hypothetical protein